MTTKLLLVLSLSVSFVACDKETDFISEANEQFSSTLSNLDMDVSTTNRGLSTRDSSIEVTTTHWLTGVGKDQSVLQKEIQEDNGGSMPSLRYVIEASGDAMSETFARGFSELNLIYHTGTQRLTGVLVTRFCYGETLELKFDGDVHVSFNGQTMNLRVNINEATFRTSTEVFELSYGEVIFLLPLKPEGALKIDIHTNSTLFAF